MNFEELKIYSKPTNVNPKPTNVNPKPTNVNPKTNKCQPKTNKCQPKKIKKKFNFKKVSKKGQSFPFSRKRAYYQKS